MATIRNSRDELRQPRDGMKVAGDPGVGGLLADPLEVDQARDEIDPAAGPASNDAPPPTRHGDWSPNKRSSVAGAIEDKEKGNA